MSEPRRFPFGGVPVYNPQSLSKTEALAQFQARQAAYEDLMGLLREERPSHVLIIGTRGMGKTTLLQRVRYGVEEDALLNSRYLVLAFPEEQYNVNHLHHFMLNTVDALADALERLGWKRLLVRVEAHTERLKKLGPEGIEKEVPRFLDDIGKEIDKSFLLLVDNADRLFDKIESREQWNLRELLSNRPDLTFFGATTQASDGIYGPDRAFFEFFQIRTLAPLTFEEVRELLLQLSEAVEEKEGEKGAAKRRVEEWLSSDAARLRTLVQLTGGNPRTTVLLFHLVLDGFAGGAREYLEQLLDQCTPGYKGRVDELPPQAQQVLDAVALRWDPVTAMEVGEDTGLETNAVSTHLTRLVRQGLLEKADPGDSKKALYQVAERFFNIWYLMRASRRVRAKLRWFVEFLRVFHEPTELEQMAWEQLQHLRSSVRPAEIETAFAYVLASRTDCNEVAAYLRRECADKEKDWILYLDSVLRDEDGRPGRRSEASSPEEEVGMLRRAVEIEPGNAKNWARLGALLAGTREHAAESKAALLKAIDIDPKMARAWAALGIVLLGTVGPGGEAEAALRKAVGLDPKQAGFWNSLGDTLARAPERRGEAEAAYRRAIELDPGVGWFWNDLGHALDTSPERRAEAEAAYRRAISLAPEQPAFWNDLADLLDDVPGRSEEAEAAYRKAIELDPRRARSWNNLGVLLGKAHAEIEKLEASFRNAVDLDPNVAGFWNNLGNALARTPERWAEAEKAYGKAIGLDPSLAEARANLGNLLRNVPSRREEAAAAYRKALELNPHSARFWHNLGRLLIDTERLEEAEAAYRKAIELDPTISRFWHDLAVVLEGTRRLEEAEAAYRKAIELDPKSDLSAHIGSVLAKMPGRLDEADETFRTALALDPKDGHRWGSYGVFLACQAGKPGEAETALRRSVELEPDDSRNLRNLGVLLYCELANEQEAVEYVRRAAELEPADPVSAAIFASCVRGSEDADEQLTAFIGASGEASFWGELLGLCENYPPFGKILVGICDLVLTREISNRWARLYRAVALAQLGDFPRASVALEDALTGDPIDLLKAGRKALETFFAAAVRKGRVRDCVELVDKKGWKDAWRPIYEALRSVEEGSAEYLKRVAGEIREPAMVILRQIAPELSGLPARTK